MNLVIQHYICSYYATITCNVCTHGYATWNNVGHMVTMFHVSPPVTMFHLSPAVTMFHLSPAVTIFHLSPVSFQHPPRPPHFTLEPDSGHLILVTGCVSTGRIGNAEVFRVTGTTFVCLANGALNHGVYCSVYVIVCVCSELESYI